MNWIDRLRKDDKPDFDSQFLYYVRGELLSQYFALVRVTWYDSKGVCCVSETRINRDDTDVMAEFTEIVGLALRAGSCVCVICGDDPEHLGIYDT